MQPWGAAHSHRACELRTQHQSQPPGSTGHRANRPLSTVGAPHHHLSVIPQVILLHAHIVDVVRLVTRTPPNYLHHPTGVQQEQQSKYQAARWSSSVSYLSLSRQAPQGTPVEQTRQCRRCCSSVLGLPPVGFCLSKHSKAPPSQTTGSA